MTNMKDDTISRAAALDALGERPVVWSDNDDYTLGERNQYDMDRLAIETVPSAQPGWIPCKTALPTENGQYIITVKYEHVDGYEDIYSEHGEWVDGHWDAGFGHCGRVEKVLAWQPLPTPYREGGQDEQN